jgi:hypothetical protein
MKRDSKKEIQNCKIKSVNQKKKIEKRKDPIVEPKFIRYVLILIFCIQFNYFKLFFIINRDHYKNASLMYKYMVSMVDPNELENFCINNKVRIDQTTYLQYNFMANINIFKFVNFSKNSKMVQFCKLWEKKFDEIMTNEVQKISAKLLNI